MAAILLLQAAPAWAATHDKPATTTQAPAFQKDTTPLPADVTGGSSGSDKSSGTVGVSSTSGTVARTIVGLAIVLAVVYGLYWLLKSTAKSRAAQSDERIAVVATTTLAPNRALHLVRSGDELILIGATEQSVTPIRVYSAEEARAMDIELAAAAQLAQTPGRQTAPTGMIEALRRRTTPVSTLPLLADHATTINLVGGGKAISGPVQIFLLLTLLAVLPGALLMLTGFTRILIVLGFVRSALGTPTTPPTQVLVGMSIFLSLFVMAPTLKQVNSIAVQPYTHHEIGLQSAIDRGQEPLRTFMFKQTRDSDLALFVSMADLPRPKTRADIPTYVLIPSFMISELKTAFQIGFLIYLPFLIIDMVVSSTLMSMGMMMLPPVLISLPFKIMLFVLVDGWHLVVQSLVQSFHT